MTTQSAGPRRGMSSGLTTVFLVVMTGYFLLPVYWLFVASTKDTGDLASTHGLWFGRFNLVANLRALLARDDGVYLRWVVNSVLYAGAGALVGTLLAAMAGYALSMWEFRGRELVFSVILGGVLVPATALALPLFLLFARFHLTNSFWAVFLPSIVSPFGVYLSRIYATAAVPDELVEAARIDGAGEYRIFAGLVLRLMSPALVTIFLFQFVAIWNNFFLPLIMLQDQRLYPVTLGLWAWQSTASHDASLQTLAIVGSFVSTVPLVVAFLLLQRHWRSGLATGAVRA